MFISRRRSRYWVLILEISLPEDWYVNPRVLAEFYERFKDRPREEIKGFSFGQGLALGLEVVERLGIEGDDEEAIAAVLREILRDEPTAMTEEKTENRQARNIPHIKSMLYS